MLNCIRTSRGFTKRDGRIAAACWPTQETGEEFPIEARAVINAAGVFVDALRRLDESAAPPLVSPAREPTWCSTVVPSRGDRPSGPADRRRPRAFCDSLA